MRYKEIVMTPKRVRVGDVILSYDNVYRVQIINKEKDGYCFISNIKDLEAHVYDLNWFPSHHNVIIRRDSLKDTLKLL